jgi:carboxyl-terminal processing protease
MVSGMFRALDKFSCYIPPSKVEELHQRVMGRSRGVGLEAAFVGDELRVIGSMVNSPAQRAGMSAGDLIVLIDDLHVTGRSMHEVRRMLDEGKPGTTVRLTVLRQGRQPEAVSLTREEFPIETVHGLYRDPAGQWVYLVAPRDGIAYVRIKEFVPETLERVQGALRGIGPLNALVLDLRDNPGGEFRASLSVSDLFIREGTIVTLFSRHGPPQKYSAQRKVGTVDVPVAVLINGHSASGAEIVAGSLSVNDRAVLVGTRTLGKGCLQRMIRLEDDPRGQLNLTTSEYYVGDDTPIAMRGVDPHVEVTVTDSLHEALGRLHLEQELAPPQHPATAPATRPAAALESPGARMLELDPQLATAVKLLQNPQDVQDIIKGARKARLAAKAAKTQPATAPTPG